MAVDQKISQLPEALTLAEDDYVPIVQASSGLNKKAKVSAFVPDPSFIENIVFLTSADVILQSNKINWVNPTVNHTILLPTANISFLGQVIIVNNKSNVYALTVQGSTTSNIILSGENSIVGLACVTDGSGYGWEIFSMYNKSDFNNLVQDVITNGVTTIAPSQNAVFDALANKLDLDGSNANQDIDIDGFGVNAKHFKVNGTGGAGHIGLKHQSANISASASESSIGADSVGDPVWKNDGGAIDKLELQSNKTSTVTGNEASTSKYLTVKGVYDWAVGLFAPKASPTFTGTVTTPDIIVSNATASTPAFFDAVDKLISTTAQLWGTWVQTWASKATPVDADTIGFYNSASTFVGVKSTLLNFWTTYLLPKVQALGYLSGTGITTNNIPYFNGTALVNSQLTRSATSIDSSVKLTGNVLGTGAVDGIPTLANAGDFQNIRINSFAFGIAMNMRGFGTAIIKAYDARVGWTQWANTNNNPNLCYWNGQEITSGNTPTGALGGNLGNIYNGYYSYEIYDVVGRSIRGYFSVVGTVPTNLVQSQQETSGLSIAITGSPAKVVVTNSNAMYARITPLETITQISKMPELYELFSNTGLAKYWTGSEGLGIGHSSQNASAIFQVESTAKGSIPYPRMTNAQRTALTVGPTTYGLIVYCTDTVEGLWINKSTGWTFIA